MNVIAARRLSDEAARVAHLVPWMQQLATRGDAKAAFPKAELAAFQQAGILAIPLPNEAPNRQRHAQMIWCRFWRSSVAEIFPSAGCWKRISTHGDLIARFGTQTQRAQAADVKARLGNAMIAWETSRLWVLQAVRTAEDPLTDPCDGCGLWRPGAHCCRERVS